MFRASSAEPETAAGAATAAAAPASPPKLDTRLLAVLPPTYVLVGDGSGDYTLSGAQLTAAGGVAGAVIWPKRAQSVSLAIRGGTASDVKDSDALGSAVLLPGATQVNFRLEYILMRQAWWRESQMDKACWGDWCLGGSFTLQAGNTKLALQENGQTNKVSSVIVGLDTGLLLTLGNDTSVFGADFGIGPSLRVISGNAARSSHKDALYALEGGNGHTTFVGGYFSAGLRVRDFRIGAFVPVLNHDTDNISGLQMVILAQVQAQIASTSN
ncbi:MAG: hypothetical protein ABW061_06755 [Polyangiaceae bacterium]